MDLKGRVAIVTGGSREIGAAIATALSKEGAIVIIGFLNGRGMAEETLDMIERRGGKGIVWRVDVTQRRDVEEMVKGVVERYGRVDVVVNNTRGVIQRRGFSDTTWEEFQRHIDVIVKGIFNSCQAVMESMKAQRYGRIINILSNLIDDPVRGYSAYISALSAIIGFTRALALELGEYGITVNNISPGFTLTANTPYAPSYVQERIIEATPLKRLARPEDIARAVLFYASSLSEFITGDNITVDGGIGRRMS